MKRIEVLGLEVALLANAFGWSEETILQMPAVRRKAYYEIAKKLRT